MSDEMGQAGDAYPPAIKQDVSRMASRNDDLDREIVKLRSRLESARRLLKSVTLDVELIASGYSLNERGVLDRIRATAEKALAVIE